MWIGEVGRRSVRIDQEQTNRAGQTRQYTYDIYGNRVKMDVTGMEIYNTVYSYDPNTNRLTQEQTNRAGQNSQITTYGYDANGNQTIKTAPSGTEIRQYDGRNRMTGYFAPNRQATYAYQAGGLRLATTVKTSGDIWSCGRNNYGQLGDGTNVQRTTPAQISNLPDITSVTTGSSSSTFALKSDGTVWACGLNNYGQLGDGTTTNRTAPVQVIKGLTGIDSVAAGLYHAVALKSDGTVWTWGRNNYGQLGDGTTTDKLSPVQVSSLTGVVSVVANDYQTVALKSDGTVWAWGFNGSFWPVG